MSAKLLVTGASGKLGRAVVGHLLDSQGIAPERIVATTRDVAGLADLAARGVEVRRADFSDPTTLPAAFAGAGHVLIVSTDAAGSGQRLAQHEAAVAAAKAAGAARLLYTSLPDPEHSAVSFASEHLGTERAIEASGLPFTIFRNNWYFENLYMSLPHALKSGQWFTSSGDGRIAYGARDDYAAAIAAGLASDEPGNRVHTLSGPQAFTIAEIAEQASAATGKPLAVVPVSDEQLAGGLAQAGLPEPVVRMLVSFDRAAREGHLTGVTGDVQALTGRPPLTLADFLKANAAGLAG